MENTLSIRDAVHRLADDLPEDASWEEVMERVYVRHAIARGLADSDAGRVLSVEQVRAKLRGAG